MAAELKTRNIFFVECSGIFLFNKINATILFAYMYEGMIS